MLTCSAAAFTGSSTRTASRALVSGHGRRLFSSTPNASAEVELTVDGKKVKIEAGSALIQA
jgi:NADH dehydrogenase (ubiquinone) Fe-S protein 1